MKAGWEQEELRHLQSAEGWVELGLPDEALAELRHVAAGKLEEPPALTLRWRIHAAAHQWEEAEAVAERLVQRAPDDPFGWIHRSYALHEIKRTAEAEQLLEPAMVRFPKEELVPYNLACYACQLGRQEDAKSLLCEAMKRGKAKEIRARALDDPDLAPLREYVAGL